MTDYSETFLDHYRRPRNLGDLDEADAVAIVHDEVCGDVLRLAIACDRDPAESDVSGGRIRAARFKAYGCAATIAVGSVLTEAVIGLSLHEAGALRPGDLVDALGGLPPGRIHAADLGGHALSSVLARLRHDCGPGTAQR